MYQAISSAPPTPAMRYAVTAPPSGSQSLSFASAGSPRSMPYAMSAGPATWSTVLITTTTIVRMIRVRTGRASDPSSLSERCRIWRLSAFV